MTQEEIELLFQDLCARLPYGVKVTFAGYSGRDDCILNSQHLNSTYAIEYLRLKPYLRPLSSMTKEERKEYHSLCYEEEREQREFGEWVTRVYYHETIESIDWLNKHHFDYRGLIPKGLALEAKEGTYNN